MANLGTLTLDITAKTGNFTGPISKAERDVQRFSKTLDKLAAEGSTSVDRLQRSFNALNIKSGIQIDAEKKKIIAAFEAIKNSGVASSKEIQRAYAAMKTQIKEVDPAAKSLISGLGGIQTAALAAFSAVSAGAMVSQLHAAGMAAERFRNSYEAATGDVTKGAAEFAYARTEAQRLGLDLVTTADSYLKLTAAAKGTSLEGQNARAIFSAVAGASRALGLSSEQSGGALQAVQQMMSKGTVQAEELRGQLGERLPGAFQIAARAMGVTTVELGKMLEGGQVISEDFLPKFAAELEKTFPPGEKAMAGMTAETERLKTAWFDLKTTVMEGGGESLFTNVIKGFKNELKEAADLIAVITKARKGMVVSGDNSPWGPLLAPAPTKSDMSLFDSVSVPSSINPNILPDFGALAGKPSEVNFAEKLVRDTKQAEPEIKELANSTRKLTTEFERNQKAIDEQIKALQLQHDVFNVSETDAKLWEMDQRGATVAQLDRAEAILKQIDALKKQKTDQEEITENLKNYQALVRDLRTDEEKYTDTVQERLDIIAKAGKLPTADEAAKIVGSGVTKAPTFGGTAFEVGGINGEVNKIDQFAAELNAWEESQLSKQEKLQEFADIESEIYKAAEDEKTRITEEAEAKREELRKQRAAAVTQGLWESVRTESEIMTAAFSMMTDMTKNFAGENSAAYKALFAIQKIFAAAMIIANTEIAAAKAPAELTVLGGLAAATVIRATGYASAGMVAGMGLAGMAHEGMDSIPQDGTWLLKKGERVSTAETSAKLDRTLDSVSKQSSGGDAPIVNLYEDKSKAGTVENRTENDRRVIDIFVADLMGDGKAQKAMSRKFGLQPVGA